MNQRSPTLEGFRAILRRPSFGLAEITWRWSFGAAAALLLALAFFEYLDTLPVTPTDLLLLKTRQPALISRAIVHIFRGSSLRLVEAVIVLLVALAVAWILVASLARAATLKALRAYFREGANSSRTLEGTKCWRLRSLFGLNFFRVAVTVAAAVACLAPFVFSNAISPPDNPAPGAVLLIILATVMLVCLAWSVVNWFLSLAAVFVVGDGQDTFGAIDAAADLCRTRAGPVFAAGTWFGLAHVGAFVVASSVVMLPLGFAGLLPAGVILGGVLLITLLYFAVVDFLYMGRLAAYVAIIRSPGLPAAVETAAPVSHGSQQLALSIQPQSAIDPDELILSDLPAGT